MTIAQIQLFSILGLLLVFLVWGRFRFDLVAGVALLAAVLAGIVPSYEAFQGFGHPAVVVVALVLIASRGLTNSGTVEFLGRYFASVSRGVSAHIGIFGTLAAALSTVMNNVGALALFMPLDMQAAKSARRDPALTLMPLSFATILGGMVTLIGTPPNIIIASFRGEVTGQPYEMFDFTPVGLLCAAVGILFIATIGWRLIPGERSGQGSSEELARLKDYVVEVEIPEKSQLVGKTVQEADELADEHDIAVLGIIRQGHRLPGSVRDAVIKPHDLLVIEAAPDALDGFVGANNLGFSGGQKGGGVFDRTSLDLVEIVVPDGAMIAGRSALSVGLMANHNVYLLGVSRQGKRFLQRVRRLIIRPGDVLLLMGPGKRLGDITRWLGCLPLENRGLRLVQREKARTTAIAFLTAILAAVTGLVDLPIALCFLALYMIATDLIPLRELYNSIEWPVIVMLAAMIPLGNALQTTGSTALVAELILDAADTLSPVAVLVLLMAMTMAFSIVINNTATAVIAAPLGFELARSLDVSIDSFLMTVAVASSCAFLTPIGHKNNTLILGPGGYAFGDFWRMGLPLQLIIMIVSIPAILFFWPL